MTFDGILHLAIQGCPYTAIQFNSFIEALLDNMNPFPQPNLVIVMDNACTHMSPILHEMIEERFVGFLDAYIYY
jgi:coenzyme F420-reducing hydrogenase gamma subunit